MTAPCPCGEDHPPRAAYMNTTMVSVDCGKCGGSGVYHFGAYSRGACYPCNGRGKVKLSAEALAQAQAYRRKLEERHAELRAAEERTAAAFIAAESAIEARGIQGAREFFATHRTDADALAGLIDAMRNARLSDASNAVVRHRNALVSGKLA